MFLTRQYHINVFTEDANKARQSALLSFILLIGTQFLLANWTLLRQFPVDLLDLISRSATATTWSGHTTSEVFPYSDFALLLFCILNLAIFFIIGYHPAIFAGWRGQAITQIIELSSKPQHVFDWLAKYYELPFAAFVIFLIVLTRVIF